MLRSILVPLDGSSVGEHALPMASKIARRSGAAITLVHVHVPIINVYMGEWNLGGVPIVDERMDAEQRALEETYLKSVRTRFATDNLAITCVILDGPVVHSLVDYAESIHADLVAMTTHGHGSFSRIWLGSVADAFVRHSTVPTLLIRPTGDQQYAPSPTDQPWPIRRMLIPLDGSASAERILEPACNLGDVLGVEYCLLRVIEPLDAHDRSAGDVDDMEHPLMRSRHSEAYAYLVGIAARLRAQGRVVHTHVGVGRQPARAILDMAQDDNIDLIALATHGRSGVPRLLLGSVADKIVRGAERPVLLIHPQAQPHATLDG